MIPSPTTRSIRHPLSRMILNLNLLLATRGAIVISLVPLELLASTMEERIPSIGHKRFHKWCGGGPGVANYDSAEVRCLKYVFKLLLCLLQGLQSKHLTITTPLHFYSRCSSSFSLVIVLAFRDPGVIFLSIPPPVIQQKQENPQGA